MPEAATSPIIRIGLRRHHHDPDMSAAAMDPPLHHIIHHRLITSFDFHMRTRLLHPRDDQCPTSCRPHLRLRLRQPLQHGQRHLGQGWPLRQLKAHGNQGHPLHPLRTVQQQLRHLGAPSLVKFLNTTWIIGTETANASENETAIGRESESGIMTVTENESESGNGNGNGSEKGKGRGSNENVSVNGIAKETGSGTLP